ncbi:MAG: glycosyltransferase family 87 protein [Planctomycetota bacterium]
MSTIDTTAWYQRPGIWFFGAIALGALVRAHFVLATQGTYDVELWDHHARFLNKLGMIEYYRQVQLFNHPPFIGIFMSKLWTLCQAMGWPFATGVRVPFALLDFATAWLLGELFRGSPWRYVVMATYWLNPLAMILSAYHGNTDSSIAFFILATIMLASRNRLILAGLVFGLGLGVKLPISLTGPALFFFCKNWRHRILFSTAVTFAAGAAYAPLLFREPWLLKRNILDYPGSMVFTSTGIHVWGLFNFEWLVRFFPESLQAPYSAMLRSNWVHNKTICLSLILIHSWFRRNVSTPMGLAGVVAEIYMILYGFSAYWAPQYVAWSIPFWYCVSRRFAIANTTIFTLYVYGLYVFVCENFLLRGKWDFLGHSWWPPWLFAVRDLANLYCLMVAMKTLSMDVVRLFHKPPSASEPPTAPKSSPSVESLVQIVPSVTPSLDDNNRPSGTSDPRAPSAGVS